MARGEETGESLFLLFPKVPAAFKMYLRGKGEIERKVLL